MWSLFHDVFVAAGLGLHLLWRWMRGLVRGDKSISDYAAYRSGRRIDQLTNDGRPLLWFHGVSVGEVAGLDGVIAAIRQQTGGDVAIAVSTMTSDGLRAARRLTNQPDLAFIYPMDLSWFAKRVVERLQPKLLVIFDGDFWFQMLTACDNARVPVMVINGRLSERSTRNYARFSSYSKRLFSPIKLASVQSETMAERFARFVPRSRIVVDGNLKLDSAPPALSDLRRDELRVGFGIAPSRFCIVFGSVHPEEVDAIADPIRHLLASHAAVQVVIAPRHPEKFTRAVLDKYFPGISATWSESDQHSRDPAPIMWVNRLGVLRDLYQIGQAAFVGGTFCDIGGHNLAEPAQLGVPALYGPNVRAQAPLHEMLEAYGAARQVHTPDELYQAMAFLIEDPQARLRIISNLARLRADSAGLTDRVAARIASLAGFVP
jgi:3-deoxy-D-manno-octulosonic-acid transferase